MRAFVHAVAQRGSRLDMPVHRCRSICLGGFVCSASPQAENGRSQTGQHSPSRLTDKKGRNTASKPRRVRDSQTRTQSTQSLRSSLRVNPHQRSSGREAKRTRAPRQASSTLTTQRPPALPVIDSFVFQRSPSGTKRTRRPSILSSVRAESPKPRRVHVLCKAKQSKALAPP